MASFMKNICKAGSTLRKHMGMSVRFCQSSSPAVFKGREDRFKGVTVDIDDSYSKLSSAEFHNLLKGEVHAACQYIMILLIADDCCSCCPNIYTLNEKMSNVFRITQFLEA